MLKDEVMQETAREFSKQGSKKKAKEGRAAAIAKAVLPKRSKEVVYALLE